MGETWAGFLERARPNVNWATVGPILVLDPGETTGWAVFHYGDLEAAGQWDTGRNPAETALRVEEFNAALSLVHLVYEEYRVRGNKFKEHVGSEVVTIQHIGAIKVTAARFGISTTSQGAGLAKGFATDSKLRRWGLYRSNQRHANDAIRHGVYYLLFGHEPEKRRHAKP